jgi:hypothetical protein
MLVLPASRCVVLGRVEKLLDADHVHPASEDEIEGLFTDGATAAIPLQRHEKDVDVWRKCPGNGTWLVHTRSLYYDRRPPASA